MSGEWRKDLSVSAKAFKHIVWPAIRASCDGGELMPVEAEANEGLKNDLDVLAGIDGFQMVRESGRMRGIASRIQSMEKAKTNRPYNSFTLRLERASGTKTEVEKRLEAIAGKDRGWLFPHLTVQAYVSAWDGDLLSAAVVKTEDLFAYLKVWRHEVKTQYAPDGNKFLACYWSCMRRRGVRVAIVEPELDKGVAGTDNLWPRPISELPFGQLTFGDLDQEWAS